MRNFLKNRSFYSITLSVLVSFAFVAVAASAATTISTNISTGGTLSVTGASTLTGAVTTSGNATFGDASTDVNLFTGTLQASTTALFTSGFTTYGNLTVDQAATTTVTFNQAGMNFDSNTLVIDPNANRVGVLTATPNTAFEVAGTASSTSLVVGGGSTLAGIVFGTCAVDPQSIAAQVSAKVETSCTAAGIRSGDTVFVTPPSDTLATDDWLVFEGASASSTNGFIEITLFNASTTAAIDSPSRTWAFMGIR